MHRRVPLAERTDRFAGALAALGVVAGDVVFALAHWSVARLLAAPERP